MSDNRFNFNIYGNSSQTEEQRRNFRADILDFNENFEKINENGAMIDDLSKTKAITIVSNNWISINNGEYYRYTVSDTLIHPEPYNVSILFDDLTVIDDPIYPLPNTQAEGSFVLETSIKPLIDLSARLIVTKGVQQ